VACSVQQSNNSCVVHVDSRIVILLQLIKIVLIWKPNFIDISVRNACFIIYSEVKFLVIIASEGKGKFVPLLSLTGHLAMKEYCGSGGTDPHIIDLGTRWK
jgi:hypothetical protein